MLASRFTGFHKSLVNCPKFCVRYLARLAERDMRTVMGRTLDYLLVQCSVDRSNLDALSPGLVKKCLKYSEVPADEEWRIQLSTEHRKVRADDEVTLNGFSRTEVEELLAFVCTT